MMADILEAILSGLGMFFFLALAILFYYVAFRLFRDYREDECLKGDKSCIFGAIGVIFCATILILELLLILAQKMGW